MHNNKQMRQTKLRFSVGKAASKRARENDAGTKRLGEHNDHAMSHISDADGFHCDEKRLRTSVRDSSTASPHHDTAVTRLAVITQPATKTRISWGEDAHAPASKLHRATSVQSAGKQAVLGEEDDGLIALEPDCGRHSEPLLPSLDDVSAVLDDDFDSIAQEGEPDEAEFYEEDVLSNDEIVGNTSIFSAVEAEQYFIKLRMRLQQALREYWANIEELQGRCSDTIESPSLKARFSTFRDDEAALSGWNPAHLVAPSGEPSQPLHLKLNYPTFRTKHLEYGESADDTNNSTKMLIQKGLTASNAFYRHQNVVTRDWPAEVKTAHFDFSRTCEQYHKTVLLLFGAPNRKDFNQRYDVVEKTVRVSDTELVTLGFVRSADLSIRFIVVYCPHPEWLLWNWTCWAGRYYDACVNVAAVLTGVQVSPNWFEARAQNVKPASTLKTAFRDADTTRKLEKQNQVRCHPDDLPITVRNYAFENGISEEKLNAQFEAGWSVAQMVFEFIRSRQPLKSSWNSGVRMPRNMPRNAPAQGGSSTSSGSSSHTSTLFGASPAPSPSQTITIIPNKTRSKNPIFRTAVIHQGREIHLMCIRCGSTPRSKPIDDQPVFVTISAAKGKYIAQRQGCTTPACNPTGRKGQVDQFMVPQDATIPFIRSDNLSKVEVPKGAE